MLPQALRTHSWTGRANQLGDLFLMRKGTLQARCELWTHADGWECRLYAGEEDLIAAQVCRQEAEVMTFNDRWTNALGAQGWSVD